MLNLRNSSRFFSCKNLAFASRIHNEAVKGVETNYEEVRIPVPWGHIAGKWWGPQDKRPIFVMHGWQDNCGSFDRLIPLLPKDLGFLCVDFPGHGLSSQLPNGIFYHGIDAAIFMRRVQDYFGWEKMSLLGHSMGAIMCFMYTCLFPKSIDLLACIDALKPFSILPGKLIDENVKNIDKFIYYDKLNALNSKPPTYTYTECEMKQHLSFFKSINLENCKYILNRSVEKCPNEENKYYFSRDSRLKVGILINMHHDDILEHAKRISCPHIVLKASKSSYYEDKKYCYDVVDVLKDTNKLFEYHYIEGKHHVHLNEPDIVANPLNEFFAKYAYKDRINGGIKLDIILRR